MELLMDIITELTQKVMNLEASNEDLKAENSFLIAQQEQNKQNEHRNKIAYDAMVGVAEKAVSENQRTTAELVETINRQRLHFNRLNQASNLLVQRENKIEQIHAIKVIQLKKDIRQYEQHVEKLENANSLLSQHCGYYESKLGEARLKIRELSNELREQTGKQLQAKIMLLEL